MIDIDSVLEDLWIFMAQGINSEEDQNSQDPYSLLGVARGASFEEIKNARDRKLTQVESDPIARARIEASYDTLLMASLKERQLGKISNAAINASELEEKKLEAGSSIPSSILTRLKVFDNSKSNSSSQNILPYLELPNGQGLSIRIALALLSIVLLLVSPESSIDLILACSTIALFVSQIRRGRKIISSLGWSVVLLSIGLIFGGFVVSGSNPQLISSTSLTTDQLEALPALILVWAGTLLLA